MTKFPMKVGIVGSGGISGHHLRAISNYGNCQIVAIVDRDLTRARAQAERFNVPHTFESLAPLLALKPDIVHVLTPPDSHTPLVIEALAGGAHVYVEKPMAIAAADCEAMINAATRANRQLCVGHCWNYIPVIARAQRLIASGTAGEVLQVAASFNYDVMRNPTFGTGHWSSKLPGGLIEDLAVHLISVLIRLLGAPQQASALSRSSGQVPGTPVDEMRAIIEGERGLGTLSVSLRGRPDLILIDIWCTRMLLRLNVSSMSLAIHRQLPVPQKIARGLANLDVAAQLVGGTIDATWKLARGKVDGSYGIAPCIHAFYDALAS
ncbi:MAG TPA: Gfo/Idh/MocA family oxidoreductase, partial [Steroidobacteraceae bacterium]